MDERRREEESSLRGYEHEFERAADELKAAATAQRVRVTDPQKIRLYSLFKQATEGDCTKPQPSASFTHMRSLALLSMSMAVALTT